jgi:flagellar motility protein MotE (MotC chaperone)
MKAGKSGFRLILTAFCVLLTVVAIKLTVAVIGAFQSLPETTCAVPEAIAKDEKPRAEAQNAAPVQPAPDGAKDSAAARTARAKPSASESMSAFQQKEIEIRRREEQLKEKEERLSRLEKEVEQKVKDLLVLQKQVQMVQSEKQETQSAKVRGLAKIYGTMKPKEAAKLLENLDDKLVMGIIATMTPDQAAGILALMDVKKAAKISEALSGR